MRVQHRVQKGRCVVVGGGYILCKGHGSSSFCVGALGGVYMRKLAPARVSYRHDFLISYRVYMMTGLFHISLFEGTLHVDKMHV